MRIPKLFIAVFVVCVIVGVIGYFLSPKSINQRSEVTSFEECAKAGYPIQDSYPEKCRTPDGKSFTHDIGNELELRDKITIQNPRPNQVVAEPLEIRGAARGGWYFEASFPVKLVDNKGNVIAQGNAQAVGDWMTEEFVPYKATLEFKTEEKTGKLILEKSNPSGLPENADQLEVPVKFE